MFNGIHFLSLQIFLNKIILKKCLLTSLNLIEQLIIKYYTNMSLLMLKNAQS